MIRQLPLYDHVRILSQSPRDDLDREVYAILGIPIDAIGMDEVLNALDSAARLRRPYFLSTPNVNFIATSRKSPEFRETLLSSDLCTADGAPIIWIARLLKLPIRFRVSGSDIFEAIKKFKPKTRPLKVFFFGGGEDIAAQAAIRLNLESTRLKCVGHINPGFISVEAMSCEATILQINASQADLLLVSLGAKKGQEWLYRNHMRISIPVRSHFGATLNFQACAVRRAPVLFRRLGLEWLWRIKEEPHLWRRYLYDGLMLLRLFLTKVIPLALLQTIRTRVAPFDLQTSFMIPDTSAVVHLSGDATAESVARAKVHFREAISKSRHLIVDLRDTQQIDARFLGFLLMVRKSLAARNGTISFTGVSAQLKQIFTLHGVDYILPKDDRLKPNDGFMARFGKYE
ncbi:WecB/TagA/CpsF family glycosyltransferase [Nordella sp. HKS 07]|uniref:WecB/TagA/CpsF family glycosyltransferase n=1 Tax=Nordella sp. HKS 07 TaxID=2712222 RepID=UPI0013E10AC5|nr:WecB/TagA/CpsF family glycosyltransferase [Nordella sp. HKS 07]QIG51828.1 WecB/TagA/CpsF family glycosyltransferase [Nordella sp. HKS 07]